MTDLDADQQAEILVAHNDSLRVLEVFGDDDNEKCKVDWSVKIDELDARAGHLYVLAGDGSAARRIEHDIDASINSPRSSTHRAVELLRASEASEPGEAEPPPPRDPATDDELPPEDVEAPASARPLRGAISLVPLVTASPGGFNPAAHIELAGRWAPLERFALRFALWVPTVATRIVRDEGNARLIFGTLFVEPQLRLPGGASWFHPELGLGLGLSITNVVGEAVAPYRSNAKTVAGFVSHAQL